MPVSHSTDLHEHKGLPEGWEMSLLLWALSLSLLMTLSYHFALMFTHLLKAKTVLSELFKVQESVIKSVRMNRLWEWEPVTLN